MNPDKQQIEALLKEISPYRWYATESDYKGSGNYFIDNDDGKTIAEEIDIEANAKFIAAAPEIISSLLEQLKELTEKWHDAEGAYHNLFGEWEELKEQLKQKDEVISAAKKEFKEEADAAEENIRSQEKKGNARNSRYFVGLKAGYLEALKALEDK